MFMNWWCRPTVLQEDNELYRRFWVRRHYSRGGSRI